MAATVSKIGKGITFSINSTLIGEILECKPGKTTVAKVEVFRSDAPDMFVEKIPGWRDVSEWELKTTYYSSQRATLMGLLGTTEPCVFTRPDGTTTTTFNAFVSEVGDDVPLKESMTITFKLTVSGSMS